MNDTPDLDVWLPLPDVAERLGVRLSDVRRMLDDRELLASRRGERNTLCVPEVFLGEDGPLPELAGTFTVLSDAAFSDEEILEWMFARDETWPAGSTAIEAMLAGFKTEVRRRAMEEA
ncbi:transcriptional regulator [Janibacter sp. Soil728]|uniref:Rv2175c family DNA-binding protein n=1 Tax=Janibacter sp. Soil728 TaxID=1736393 RepID=UPI0006F5A36F|nr:Rv2175c family DNA-binding protein [Janibacter sp. Soil728]KRE36851.1 transcriptional regulator [Janibacter sp. Soil728]